MHQLHLSGDYLNYLCERVANRIAERNYQLEILGLQVIVG
jgi:hypothetical protein